MASGAERRREEKQVGMWWTDEERREGRKGGWTLTGGWMGDGQIGWLDERTTPEDDAIGRSEWMKRTTGQMENVEV